MLYTLEQYVNQTAFLPWADDQALSQKAADIARKVMLKNRENIGKRHLTAREMVIIDAMALMDVPLKKEDIPENPRVRDNTVRDATRAVEEHELFSPEKPEEYYRHRYFVNDLEDLAFEYYRAFVRYIKTRR